MRIFYLLLWFINCFVEEKMLKRRDFKIVKTPAVGNKGRKRKVQKKVKAKKAKLANPMLKNW